MLCVCVLEREKGYICIFVHVRLQNEVSAAFERAERKVTIRSACITIRFQHLNYYVIYVQSSKFLEAAEYPHWSTVMIQSRVYFVDSGLSSRAKPWWQPYLGFRGGGERRNILQVHSIKIYRKWSWSSTLLFIASKRMAYYKKCCVVQPPPERPSRFTNMIALDENLLSTTYALDCP